MIRGVERAALHVEESGPLTAPVVLLVHGAMDRAIGMARLARRLDADHRVVRYDRRGYARSRAAGGPYTLSANVDDLVEVLAGRPAVVFGHSFGGDVALAAAVARPDLVRAVVVYEPPLSWLPWWPTATAGAAALAVADLADVVGESAAASGTVEEATEVAVAAEAAERFMKHIVGQRVWDRLPASTRDERRADGLALVGELGDVRRAAPWQGDAVTVPVIVARGEEAFEHHRRGHDWLIAELDPSEHVVLAGAGHGAHVTHDEELALLVRRAVELANLGKPGALGA